MLASIEGFTIITIGWVGSLILIYNEEVVDFIKQFFGRKQ